VEVVTLAGHKLRGRLITCNPSYRHSFGDTVEELLHIGKMERLRVSYVRSVVKALPFTEWEPSD